MPCHQHWSFLDRMLTAHWEFHDKSVSSPVKWEWSQGVQGSTDDEFKNISNSASKEFRGYFLQLLIPSQLFHGNFLWREGLAHASGGHQELTYLGRQKDGKFRMYILNPVHRQYKREQTATGSGDFDQPKCRKKKKVLWLLICLHAIAQSSRITVFVTLSLLGGDFLMKQLLFNMLQHPDSD